MQKEAEFKEIVRILRTDIDGNKPIYYALTKIKGISYMFSNAVVKVLGLDPKRKIGTLSEDEIKKIEDCILNPKKYGIPSWLYNRRRDFETGEDKHVAGPDLDIVVEFDIRRLRKIRCYRGLRHAWHLPVRGQRTKSGYTFPPYRKQRRTLTVGVRRKKK